MKHRTKTVSTPGSDIKNLKHLFIQKHFAHVQHSKVTLKLLSPFRLILLFKWTHPYDSLNCFSFILYWFRARDSARLVRYFNMLLCFRATWSLCILVVQHRYPFQSGCFRSSCLIVNWFSENPEARHDFGPVQVGALQLTVHGGCADVALPPVQHACVIKGRYVAWNPTTKQRSEAGICV